MAASNRGQEDFMSEINVTPLVDVMLVLLIVLMVAASFAVSKSLEVTLPKASNGQSQAAPITLVIDARGAWSCEGAGISEEQLRGRIAEQLESDREPHVIVAADAASRHEQVVRAMDFLRAERVSRVSLAVTQTER